MADKAQIIDAIEALAVHCRPPIMEISQRTLWLRDWCADLSEFPLDAIATACRKWRHSGATKFPTPGQLLPLVRDSLPVEKGARVQPWRPAGPEEFRGMTVREKIRELMILAHEARTKAGPMYRNTTARGAPISKASGAHLNPEDMSESYRRWTAVAEGHEAELSRLRKVVRSPMSEAAE
jgi:hypothetical protein